jgi:serine/threonine protein kinase
MAREVATGKKRGEGRMAGTGELIGQQIGPYLLDGLLGSGGMGQVYRGRDLRLGRAVAIKCIDVSRGNGPRFAARFRRETRLLAQLDHPNILPLWDVGQAGNLLYLVTPVVEGGSLSELRQRWGGMLPPAQALSLAVQVADALQHAHERHVIHRDVKPGNLLVRSDGRVLLADFGIARSINDRPDASAGELAIGTPRYIAPEQALGDQVDGRADVYSLGAVLYELLSGRPPYTAESTTRVLVQILEGPPPPLCQVNPTLAPAVQDVVMRALASQPDARYPTAGAFAAALRQLLSQGTLLVSQPPVPSAPAGGAPAPAGRVFPTRATGRSHPIAPAPGAAPAGQPFPVAPVQVKPPGQPSPAPWKPDAPTPEPASHSTGLALMVTLLVILVLGAVVAGALVLNH